MGRRRPRLRGVRPGREGALRRRHLRLRRRCVLARVFVWVLRQESLLASDRAEQGFYCDEFAVGSLVGAVTGSMIGLATESGVLRGAGIGAISGAVFSIEVAEASRDLWHSGDSGVWTVLYMVRAFTNLLLSALLLLLPCTLSN